MFASCSWRGYSGQSSSAGVVRHACVVILGPPHQPFASLYPVPARSSDHEANTRLSTASGPMRGEKKTAPAHHLMVTSFVRPSAHSFAIISRKSNWTRAPLPQLLTCSVCWIRHLSTDYPGGLLYDVFELTRLIPITQSILEVQLCKHHDHSCQGSH